MFNADDRLSRAASAIWRSFEHEQAEYDMDGSGELGPVIARHLHEGRVAMLRVFGFTPESYNKALRERLAPDYPRMSYRAFNLLGILEVEPMDEWLDNNTFVDTGGELSSLAYLKGA